MRLSGSSGLAGTTRTILSPAATCPRLGPAHPAAAPSPARNLARTQVSRSRPSSATAAVPRMPICVSRHPSSGGAGGICSPPGPSAGADAVAAAGFVDLQSVRFGPGHVKLLLFGPVMLGPVMSPQFLTVSFSVNRTKMGIIHSKMEIIIHEQHGAGRWRRR